jgi:23S rRNA (guanosine2251-2'-O)-methyltransferase
MKNKNNLKPSNAPYHMYGKHCVLAALQNPNRRIEKIFCTQEFYKANQASFSNRDVELVEAAFLNKILGPGQNHQGIAAKVHSIFFDNIQKVDLSDPNCKLAILDQISDPQNIGSIIRSAAAFGITAIILPQDNSPYETASMAKISSGTIELVKIVKVTNLKSTMEFLKKEGFWIIGFDGEAEEVLNVKLMEGRVVISLGSEDKGLRRLTKEACDHLVQIPMSKTVESLNVASAASIAFYLSFVS